jgi:hypothetical protein
MEEHKFLNFLRKHWSKLLLGILAIASVAVWGERFFSSKQTQSQQDFILAHQIFERFHNGETLALESIEAAEMIVERHPELNPKYNTMLAMTYLAQRNPKGLFYAKTPLKHTAQILPPHYRTYAETSILIAEKKYTEAYQEAKALHAELKTDKACATLCALNLLRMLSLEMELDLPSEVWNELKAHPAYASISPLFKEGSLSLEDWHSLRLNNYE